MKFIPGSVPMGMRAIRRIMNKFNAKKYPSNISPNMAGRILLWTTEWQVMLPVKTVSVSSRNEVSQRT